MKIEKLTSEQESQLEVYKNKWLNKVFDYQLNKKSSFENTMKQMKDLYKLCKLDEPIVLHLESPMGCQIAANIMANIHKMYQVVSQVPAQVMAQMEAQVRSQVVDQVRSQVEDQVEDQVRSQVEAQVRSQVWAQVAAQVASHVHVQVVSQVPAQVASQMEAQVRSQVVDQVEAQVRSQMEAQVRSQVVDQVRSQVRSQVEAQVRSQVEAQVAAQVHVQVASQVVSQVRSQVWSQMEAQVRSQVWTEVAAQVRSQVEDQVEDQVWSQVTDQVEDQVVSQVWSQVRSQVEDQVRSQVRSQVADQVRSQVWAQVADQVHGQENLTYYPLSYYVNYSDFSLLSWLDFMQGCLNLNLSENLNKWIEWVDSSFMSIQLDGLCIVSNFPSFISRNEANDLHNLEGYAVSFNDGYGQHYINGKFIHEKIFNEIKSGAYSLESFLKEQNEEIKAVSIEMMQLVHGDSYLVRFFGDNLKEVDVFVDKKEEKYLKGTTGGMNIGVYALYKGQINGDRIAYVQCYCPSTDRMFFLGVEPHHTNAKDAIASLYRVPTFVRHDIKSISRQGERFFTTFTDEGYKKLESCKEIEEYSTISGDEYFSKIEYEF